MTQRILKFRAWDKEDKKMLRLCALGIDDYRGVYLPESYKNNTGKAGMTYVGNYPDDFILMQYTGLKDKNGLTEVYEGDILTSLYKSDGCKGLYEVIWYVGGFGVRRHKEHQQTSVTITMSDLQRCEVIGNVYENPELLK